MNDIAIEARGIIKSFGEVRALGGVDLAVPRGEVLGLLGPNGSGKTTLVRVLTTLTLPDAGEAFVEGHDVAREPSEVRRLIGLAGQFSAIDDHLTGFENLEMAGRLFHLDRATARRRAGELLERLDLSDAASRRAKTYSGGMRRRLDLAACLVAQPAVLFLDEPTTGLDPKSRLDLWSVIRDLVAEGATLLLTTQYLEEADQLANAIVVLDHGQVIARGTSSELKGQVGGDVLECTIVRDDDLERAMSTLAHLATSAPTADATSKRVRLAVGSSGSTAVVEAVRALDAATIEVVDLGIHRPSLDDVFLALTGHRAEEDIDGDLSTTRQRQDRHSRRQSRVGSDAVEPQ